MIRILLSITLWFANPAKCAEQALAIKQGIEIFNNSIALEASSYMDFVKNSELFVDNSLLIYDIHRNINSSAFFFLGPNEWGKSINLDMIKAFYDESLQDKQQRERFFQNSEIITDDGSVEKLQNSLLLSSKNATFVKEHMGKYAVISVSFKDVEGEDTAAAVEKKIKVALSNAYREHGVEFLNTNSLKSSLCLLFSTIAKKNPERKIWIIVEDYDKPILNLIQNKEVATKDTYHVYSILQSMIPEVLENKNLFTDSQKVEQLQGIIVTGRFGFRYDGFSYRNFYIAEKSHPEDEYFAFKEDLVKKLFELYKIDEKLSRQALKFYQYQFGNEKYYSPSSIAQFLKNKKLDYYSRQNDSHKFIQCGIKANPKLAEPVLALLNKKSVPIQRSVPLLECDIEYKPWLNQMFGDRRKSGCVPNFPDGKRFVSYLLQGGYLSLPDNTTNEAKLANGEMAAMMVEYLTGLYKVKHRITNGKLIANLTASLRTVEENETKEHEVKFEQLLSDVYNSSTQKSDEAYRAIFSRVLFNIQTETKFQIDVYHNKSLGADYVILNEDAARGVIIQLCANSTAEDALSSAEKHLKVFENFKFVQTKVLIGINISPEMKAKVLVKRIKK